MRCMCVFRDDATTELNASNTPIAIFFSLVPFSTKSVVSSGIDVPVIGDSCRSVGSLLYKMSAGQQNHRASIQELNGHALLS